MEPRCPPTAAQLPSVEPIRCFKLGRGRRSYNEVSLRLADSDGHRTASLQQCIHIRVPAEAQESTISFHVQLPGRRLLCRLFLVFDDPKTVSDGGDEADSARLCWRPVTRAHCTKGCQGPVLASSRRVSSLGKRRPPADCEGVGAASEGAKAEAQHPNIMYVSIDEPCTHCNVAAFRLIAGIFDDSTAETTAAPAISTSNSPAGPAGQAPEAAAAPAGKERLLGTAVSPPLKVLANNDVPGGPGKILLEAVLPADWEGWEDPAVWSSPCKKGARSKGGPQPAASSHAPRQPRCKVHRSCSAPSLAAVSESGSLRKGPQTAVAAARSAASGPARLAVETVQPGGSTPELSRPVEVFPAQSASPPAWQEPPPAAAAPLRSVTPVLVVALPQHVASFGAASAMTQLSQPPYSLLLPEGHAAAAAEGQAAAAAAAASWQQQQVQQQLPARQAALAQLASQLQVLPPPLGGHSSGCLPLPAAPATAHLRRYLSEGAAGVLSVQAQHAEQAATSARQLARIEAQATPGFYRAVRTPGLLPMAPSPFGAPPSALLRLRAAAGTTAPPSFGAAPVPSGQLSPAPNDPTQWPAHLLQQQALPVAAAVSLPTADAGHSWADLRSTSSTPQPGAALLPNEVGVAVASMAAPCSGPWPMQPLGTLPPPTALLNGVSAAGVSSSAACAGSWDVHRQYAAQRAAVMRQADAHVLAAGLAAAGRLGLVPSSSQQQMAPGEQALAPFQQVAAQQAADLHEQAAAQQQAAYQQASAVAQQQAAAQQQVLALQQAAAQQQAAALQRAAHVQQAAAQYQAAAQQADGDLPREADLLGLMLDVPNEFDSMVSSIFDDVPPF